MDALVASACRDGDRITRVEHNFKASGVPKKHRGGTAENPNDLVGRAMIVGKRVDAESPRWFPMVRRKSRFEGKREVVCGQYGPVDQKRKEKIIGNVGGFTQIVVFHRIPRFHLSVRETDAFQGALIFDAHAATFEEVEQRSDRFALAAGAGRDGCHQLPKREFVPVDFAVGIFHGFV